MHVKYSFSNVEMICVIGKKYNTNGFKFEKAKGVDQLILWVISNSAVSKNTLIKGKKKKKEKRKPDLILL